MAESKVSRNNYISVQGWMIRDLGLKGNELLIYACIYGFSQAENQVFSGSLQYLADWTNSTKQGVTKCLKSLVEKGFIVKSDKVINGVKFCEYYATELEGVLNKVAYPMQQSCTGGIKQSLTNNISNNLLNNIENKKDIRHKYGEYQNVLLSDLDLEKLKNEFPNDYGERIERLSAYMKSTGKSYKDHLATIRNWARKDAGSAQPKKENPTDDFMSQLKAMYQS
jgi:predicted transcriptional regulator